MASTNPKKLHAALKDFLDLAVSEPMRIQRRNGEIFIFMNEGTFAGLQNEILSLQRRLLGMSEAAEGKGTEHKIGDLSRLNRFKNKNPA